MIKKYVRRSIIAIMQWGLLLVLALLLATLMLHHTNQINNGRDFLQSHHAFFLIVHMLFYIALFIAWPRMIRLLAKYQTELPTLAQMKKALHARYYLIGAFLLIELLHFGR